MSELPIFFHSILAVCQHLPLWLYWVFGSALSLYVARLLSYIKIGPVSIMGASLLAAFVPFLFTDNGPWYLKVFQWLAVSVLGFIVNTIRAFENDWIQKRRDRQGEDIKQKIHTLDKWYLDNYFRVFPYFLYLRAFDTTRHLDTYHSSASPGSLSEHMDLETLLLEALTPKGLLLAFGCPGEMTGGSIRIEAPDDAWKDEVAAFARHASTIVLIPSYHAGTLWEIEWLWNNPRLLERCLWIMPETVTTDIYLNLKNPWIGSSITSPHHYDPGSHWTQTAIELRRRGIELPPYNRKGLIFLMDHNGTVSASLPLALSRHLLRVRRLRKLLNIMRSPTRRSRVGVYTAPKRDMKIGKPNHPVPACLCSLAGTAGFVYAAFHSENLLSVIICIVGAICFLLVFLSALSELL